MVKGYESPRTSTDVFPAEIKAMRIGTMSWRSPSSCHRGDDPGVLRQDYSPWHQTGAAKPYALLHRGAQAGGRSARRWAARGKGYLVILRPRRRAASSSCTMRRRAARERSRPIRSRRCKNAEAEACPQSSSAECEKFDAAPIRMSAAGASQRPSQKENVRARNRSRSRPGGRRQSNRSHGGTACQVWRNPKSASSQSRDWVPARIPRRRRSPPR